MFLMGQNCLFRTLVAVCDPALETATSVRNKQFCPIKNMAHITVKGFIFFIQDIIQWSPVDLSSSGYHPHAGNTQDHTASPDAIVV